MAESEYDPWTFRLATPRMSRRRFVGIAGATAAAMMFGGVLAGCSGSGEGSSGNGAGAAAGDIDYADWDAVLAAAKGQTVSWYGWGGDEARNTWINTVLAPALKDKYDITLDLVGMDINDILTQLSGEMQAGVPEGSIDFIWINGENFYSCKDNGYLWGPFTSYLPNFNDYIDAESPEVAYDFGSPTEGFECPYGKAQMQMWYNSDIVDNPPTTVESFKTFCRAHPGQVTYPEPGDFTGTAFISCLIAGVVGKDEVRALVSGEPHGGERARYRRARPGLPAQAEPLPLEGGLDLPADSSTVATMYADGELILNMGYARRRISSTPVSCPTPPARSSSTRARWATRTSWPSPPTRRIRPRHWWPSTRWSRRRCSCPSTRTSATSRCSTWRSCPGNDSAAFADVPLGSTQIPLDDLLGHRIAEAAGPVIPILEKLWLERVAQG